MNSILEKDINEINSSQQINWDLIDNHSFLVTGATGVIGTIFVKTLLKRNKRIKFILPVRSIEKGKRIFGEDNNITFIQTNIENFNYEERVDYVIHAASPTKSKFFVDFPVQTLDTSILGTKQVLEYCAKKNILSMVYLSSMEMYGVLDKNSAIEEDLGYINPLNERSSYSEGKRVCELYSYSYFKEYNVPVKIARVAMTFGAGILASENRVYTAFCDSILKKEDIVLKSKGDTIINFSYTTDTILGILKILTEGQNGEAYNIVGNPTNMDIKKCAIWLADSYGNGQVNVVFDIPKTNAGFAPSNSIILSNKKLKSIGWEPQVDIKEGYRRLLEYMKEEFYNE